MTKTDEYDWAEMIEDALNNLRKVPLNDTLITYWEERHIDPTTKRIKESLANQFTLEEILDDVLFCYAQKG